MRHVGTLALIVGIFGALFGLAYSAFVLLREWTLLANEPLATSGGTTIRVEAKALRPYWADIELSGTARPTANALPGGKTVEAVDHDIPVKARIVDASGTELRVVDVHLDANAKLPVCTRLAEPNLECGEVRLDGPSRGRITMQLRLPPVTATTDGALTYAIELAPNARGDVTLERAKLTVYRSSREEVIRGLITAAVALIVGAIAFRLAARRR